MAVDNDSGNVNSIAEPSLFPWRWSLQGVILLIASALLFSIPFRATVDKRGGILALLVILMLIDHARRKDWRSLIPNSNAVRAVGMAWLGTALLWALSGPMPIEALRGVRSDVLAPILAFCVFHALTNTRQDLFRWALVCAVAAVLVTGFALYDPYQPGPLHRPAYIDAGVLSAWLVLVAALLPVLWCAPARQRRWSRPLTLIVTIAIALSAIASANRVIWTCFAGMTLVAFAILARGSRDARLNTRRRLCLALALAALVGMGWASVQGRASAYGARAEEASAYVLNDPRPALWREGARMFADRPLTGYGFNAPAWRVEFSSRARNATPPIVYDHAHNAILNYALQMGVMGALLVILLFTIPLGVLLRRSNQTALARLAVGCGAALVTGFFLRNLTDDYFIRQPLLLYAALLGMFAGASRSNRLSKLPHGRL